MALLAEEPADIFQSPVFQVLFACFCVIIRQTTFCSHHDWRTNKTRLQQLVSGPADLERHLSVVADFQAVVVDDASTTAVTHLV